MINPITAVMGMLSLYCMHLFIRRSSATPPLQWPLAPYRVPCLYSLGVQPQRANYKFVNRLICHPFLWQFPHFWSIGFLGFEDYKKAGYKLLPENNGEIDRNVGLYALLYTLLIVPVLAYLFQSGNMNVNTLMINGILTLVFAYFSFSFYRKLTERVA